jgi:hypothetical protein
MTDVKQKRDNPKTFYLKRAQNITFPLTTTMAEVQVAFHDV